MFSLICTRINGWVNNGEAGDLRRHRAHYDVTIMHVPWKRGDRFKSWKIIEWSFHAHVIIVFTMMTSLNEDAFRINGPLWAHVIHVFLLQWASSNVIQLNKESSCQWIDTPWRSCDTTIILCFHIRNCRLLRHWTLTTLSSNDSPLLWVVHWSCWLWVQWAAWVHMRRTSTHRACILLSRKCRTDSNEWNDTWWLHVFRVTGPLCVRVYSAMGALTIYLVVNVNDILNKELSRILALS